MKSLCMCLCLCPPPPVLGRNATKLSRRPLKLGRRPLNWAEGQVGGSLVPTQTEIMLIVGQH